MKSGVKFLFALVLGLVPLVASPVHADIENLEVVVTPEPPGVVNQLGGVVPTPPGGETFVLETEFTVAAADIDEADEALRATGRIGTGTSFDLDCDPVNPMADPVQFACEATPENNAGLAAALLLLPPGLHTVTVTVERLVDGDVVETDTDGDTFQVVIPDIATLQEVVQAMATTTLPGTNRRLIKNRGQAQRLLASLKQAARFADRGSPDKACRHLDVFIKKVRTQAGRHIHSLAAAKLIADAEDLCVQLEE